MSRRAGRKQEVCSASTQYGSLITEPNCLIRSETTRKPQCYTAPGQRPPSLTAGRAFSSYLGAGGRANSPVAPLNVAQNAARGRGRGISVQSLAHVLGQEEKGSGPRTGADFLPPRNIWNLCGFCGKYGRLVVEPRPFVYLKQLCRNGRVLETV